LFVLGDTEQKEISGSKGHWAKVKGYSTKILLCKTVHTFHQTFSLKHQSKICNHSGDTERKGISGPKVTIRIPPSDTPSFVPANPIPKSIFV
jgi:hypothetical protein